MRKRDARGNPGIFLANVLTINYLLLRQSGWLALWLTAEKKKDSILKGS